MNHLNYFALDNFKAFQTKCEFDLKPITFLIGKNSSGKSSLTKGIRLCQNLQLPYIMDKSFQKSKIGNFDSVKNLTSNKDDIEISLPYYIIGILTPFILTLVFKKGKNEMITISKIKLCLKSDNSIVYESEYHPNAIEQSEYRYKIEWPKLIQEFLNSKKYTQETYAQYILLCDNLGVEKNSMPKKEYWDKSSHFIKYENDYLKFLELNRISNLFPELNNDQLSENCLSIFYFVETNFISSNLKLEKSGRWKLETNLKKWLNKFTIINEKFELDEQSVFEEYISNSGSETMFLYKFLNEEGKKFFGPYLEEIKQFEINNFYQLTDLHKSGGGNDFFNGLYFYPLSSDQKLSFDDAGLLVQKFIKSEFKVDINENEILIDGSNYSFFKNYIATCSVEKSCNILNNIFEKIEYIPSYRFRPERYMNYDDDLSFFHNYILSDPNFDSIDYRSETIDWIKKFEIADEIQVVDIKELGIKIPYLYKNGISVNYSDVGYGHLQILPLIFKCCLKKPKILIVEEPEANLHPALQSKLAEFFIFCQKNYGTQFIIETHSEYLIRKMQSLIAAGDFPNEQTNIYYFHADEDIKDPKDKVKQINFEHNGILSDTFGPGFYDEADKLSLQLLSLTYGQKN